MAGGKFPGGHASLAECVEDPAVDAGDAARAWLGMMGHWSGSLTWVLVNRLLAALPESPRAEHVWFAQGRYVHHSSRGYGHGSDSIGVGLGEDVLGPFSSHKMAQGVACALTNAHEVSKGAYA